MTDQNKKEILTEYLLDKIERKNKIYFKSNYISDDLNLTPTEVGTNIRQLKNTECPLEISKFSSNTPTTWKIKKSNM